MNLLEFDSLYLEFGLHRVLSGIYMKSEQGCITALLGRNGSGKSCLMKVVFGSMTAEAKSVRFNKIPLIGNYQHKKIIAYLPQDHLLPSAMKLDQALRFFQIDPGKIEAAFPALIPYLDKRAYEMSGGLRRLAEVLLILYANHPFCLLDEPFSGLMPVHIERLEILMQQEKMRKGIIITDHIYRHVQAIADQLYVLSAGKTHLIRDQEQLVSLGYLSSIL